MKNAITFVAVVFLFCMGMFVYNYFTENTHQMVFWGVLVLVNSSNLSDLRHTE